MKKVFTRENLRSSKVITRQQKTVQSQSPPQKQLIKKIQLKHPEQTHKSDYSLQDKLVFQEAQPQILDFRGEIEKRYNKSYSNRIYVFPLTRNKYSDTSDQSDRSANSSLESLKHVTVYDLNAQNTKTKRSRNHDSAVKKHAHYEIETTGPKLKSEKSNLNILTDVYEPERHYQTEARKADDSQERTQHSYKKLLNILDHHAQHTVNSTKQSSSPYQTHQFREKFQTLLAQRQINKQNNMRQQQQTLKNKLSERTLQAYAAYSIQASQAKEGKTKSQERRSEYSSMRNNDDYSNNSAIYGKSFQKTLSREYQIPSIETSCLVIDKSLRNPISSSTKTTTSEGTKFRQESMKKIYNNSLLRSGEPSSASSKNMLKVKDTILKNENSQNILLHRQFSPSNTLYQKAQNEILNGKKKPSTSTEKVRKQESVVTLNLLSPTEREETPKSRVKKTNFVNFYVSPSALTTIHSSQSKLSKKNSLKTTLVVSPAEKKKEKSVQISQDLSKDGATRKTPFKLNLNKRSQENRDVLTSSRSRSKMTTDKISEMLNSETILRMSYDTPHYGMFSTSSTTKSGTKKSIGLLGSNTSSIKLLPNAGKMTGHHQLK